MSSSQESVGALLALLRVVGRNGLTIRALDHPVSLNCLKEIEMVHL